MFSQRGNLLVVIFVAVIIAVTLLTASRLVYQYYSTGQKESKTRSLNLRPTPLVTGIDKDQKIENWKTYSNSQYAFSFSYPPELVFQETVGDATLLQVMFNDSAKSGLPPLSIEVRDAKSLEEEVDYRRWRVIGHLADKIDYQESVTVSSQQGIKLGYQLLSPKETRLYDVSVIVPFGGHFYTISGESMLVQQIITTFSFTDQQKASAPTTTLNIFFNNSKLNNDPNFLECGRVYPVSRTVPKTKAVATAALHAWLAGPTEKEIADGYSGGTHGDVTLRSVAVTGGVATADFHFASSPEFDGPPISRYIQGTCGTESFVSQVTTTLKQFPTIKEVHLAVDGSTNEFSTWAGSP